MELPEIQTIKAIQSSVFVSNNGYVFIFEVVKMDNSTETETMIRTGRFISVRAECRNAFYMNKVYTFDISV